MSGNGAREPTGKSDVVAAYEYVDVLAYLALFRGNTIPHAGMEFPQDAERIRQCRGLLLNPNIVAAAGEFSQRARDVKGHGHDYLPLRRVAAAAEGFGLDRAAGGIPIGFELEAAEPLWMIA